MKTMGFRSCLRVLWLLLLATAWTDAQAHLMPPGQGAIRLVGDSAYAVIALPVTVLAGVDDDHDGRMSLAELNAHRADVDRQVSARLQVHDGAQPGRLIFGDLLISHGDEPGFSATDHLIVVRRYQWPEPIQSFRLRLDIFDHAAQDAQFMVRVIQGEHTEAAVLTRRNAEHTYFAGAWAATWRFVKTGAEHILLGLDHLLFLLTVIVVGAGWRYWLAVVTSFTLAHSITLALAALGVIQAPAALIEPLIAASIVLLALDNLLRPGGKPRHRVLLVFACGLLHGLGIGALLTDIGLDTRNRVLSLLGFNLGVEIGQLVFVLGAIGLLRLAEKHLPAQGHKLVLRGCSMLAVVIGAGWLIQRTWGMA